MSGEPALLELRDVGKDFGSVIALDGVSTTVRAGEVTCVLGDNGAGKSTLIKVLAGAHQPDAGVIRWQGEETRLTGPAAFAWCAEGVFTVAVTAVAADPAAARAELTAVVAAQLERLPG